MRQSLLSCYFSGTKPALWNIDWWRGIMRLLETTTVDNFTRSRAFGRGEESEDES